MSKTRRFWLGIAFSAAFSTFMLYLVIHDVDWQAAFAAIARINLPAVLAAMLLIGLGLVARGFRWLYLLCHRLGISRSISLTFIAFLINNLLPFRAGDLARIELAARGPRADIGIRITRRGSNAIGVGLRGVDGGKSLEAS